MAIVFKSLPAGWSADLNLRSLTVRGNVRYAALVSDTAVPGFFLLSMWKTVDFGDTWVEMDAANRIEVASAVVRPFCGGQAEGDPDNYHCVVGSAGHPSPAAIGKTFDFLTDTWGAAWGGNLPYDNTGVTGGVALATTVITFLFGFLSVSGKFSVFYTNGAVDHTGFPIPGGNGPLGRVRYASCPTGGAWSGVVTEPMSAADQTIGFGFMGQAGFGSAGIDAYGLDTHYAPLAASNITADIFIDVTQTCYGFASPAPIEGAVEVRMRLAPGGLLQAGQNCWGTGLAVITAPTAPSGLAMGPAGSNLVLLYQNGVDIDCEVIADGVVPSITPANLKTDYTSFGVGYLGYGINQTLYLFLLNNATGDFVYQTHDGTSWSAEALASTLIPSIAGGLLAVYPVGYSTGFIGMANSDYYDKENTGLDIIGGAPFGGPSVPVGGKVSLVGASTGVGGAGLIPGGWPGWPVWPPYWQSQNAFDRCLIAHKESVRGVHLSDQSRCIVWEEMGNDLERMPRGGREFYERGSIVTPGPAPTDTLVMEFTAPSGYLGILYGILLHYTGTGFEEGSGDIEWRVKVGNGWAAQGLGSCLFQLGTVGQCLSLTDYIAVNSNQRVQVLVNVPNTSGNIQVGASRILATIQGWWYPL